MTAHHSHSETIGRTEASGAAAALDDGGLEVRPRRVPRLMAVTALGAVLALTACGEGTAQAADGSDEDQDEQGEDQDEQEEGGGSGGRHDDRSAVGDTSVHGGAQRITEDQTDEIREAVQDAGAKNVILLIGDGMADSELTIARNYEHGAGGFLPGLDSLPMTGQYTTYALDEETGDTDYVIDSAASATAWSTGTKTYNGALGVDVDGESQETILEMAQEAGLRTGNVSTAEIQDATPAALVSHISQRGCYGPEETADECPEALLEDGGAGSITEQYLEARADVTLGGGAETFEQEAVAGDWEGMTLMDQAEDRGYQVVTDAEELGAVESADDDAPLLGLFSDGNMPVRWEGPLATEGGADEGAKECTENEERTEDIPDLATMTDKAIELLDDDEGFFLQVEGASIDKENHAHNPCGQIGETIDLDEATEVAMDFAEEDGETLVVVTADHAHTSQITYTGEDTPGLTRTLTTNEGAEMTVSYGTAEEDESQMHTGAQLRIAAYGPGAANVVGLTDQTDLFFTMAEALDFDVDRESAVDEDS
ncbi:MAG: alkaline phosphatase [Nesterenkonia sp.]|uniref:alkaline phosphatase n=1 Tax=Nesterenkonia marinintestina TaxID=2979865 RepID=UPI0021C0EA38|nr:alkaline phosphatase [Nesterenkonia sp. GX14115]MDO5493600.1 alkaline phosphatase [Nesterenkonia sp.]